MKNTVFSILLLLCMVAPIATTGLFFHYQKKQVRREIKWKIIAGVDKSELVLLKFTEMEKKTQLRWKHSKEFEYKAEMYDIVETQVLSDTTYFWCWWDHEETKLNKQLTSILSLAWGHNLKHNESQNRLLTFYKSLYFNHFQSVLNNASSALDATHFYSGVIYFSIPHSPIKPPPRFLNSSI